jgi:hypothetical protein
MPFSGVIDSKVALPTKTARAIAGIVADSGSNDQRMHRNAVIHVACPPPDAGDPGCGAQVNERCAARRYPSGRVQQFARDFCPARYAAAEAQAAADAERDERIRAWHDAEVAGRNEHDDRPHCTRHHWHMPACRACRTADGTEPAQLTQAGHA